MHSDNWFQLTALQNHNKMFLQSQCKIITGIMVQEKDAIFKKKSKGEGGKFFKVKWKVAVSKTANILILLEIRKQFVIVWAPSYLHSAVVTDIQLLPMVTSKAYHLEFPVQFFPTSIAPPGNWYNAALGKNWDVDSLHTGGPGSSVLLEQIGRITLRPFPCYSIEWTWKGDSRLFS